jgi:hypothetical protein
MDTAKNPYASWSPVFGQPVRLDSARCRAYLLRRETVSAGSNLSPLDFDAEVGILSEEFAEQHEHLALDDDVIRSATTREPGE